MDQFRTEVIVKDYPFRMSHRGSSVFIGSCFTDHIGSKMLESGFSADINPFGVVYNPVSVKKSLEILLETRKFTEKDLHFYNKRWFSFYHHSSFSNADKSACLREINSKIRKASIFLKEASFLFITFGTARIFRLNETGEIVSNCHKLPAAAFSRELLSVEEIVKEYDALIIHLNEINPKLQIIFTVSPVRHWKDGAEGNQVSKSVLQVAVHQLVEKYNNAFYFPSYEIMMDDLRDYRFYADDMIHISPVAVNYIWEKFKNAFFDQATQKIIHRIENIYKALRHRPFDIHSKAHHDFLKKVFLDMEEMEKQFSFLDFGKEKEGIRKQLV